ncbi:MAG TPA: hypothetical protein P5556_10185 [Candidatus Gastranaerophilales bacterium]|nr:hypothetical protein [Candidatus Gastranaerophilales bacterium]
MLLNNTFFIINNNIQSDNLRKNQNILPEKNINFTGLTRDLGNKAFHYEDSIIKQVDKYPNADGVVGSLPSEWINRIPEEQRSEKIKNLHKEFKIIVCNIRKNYNADNASNEMNKAFHEAGILTNKQKLTLKKIDGGSFGMVYLLNICPDEKSDKYVIKVFDNTRTSYVSHGAPTEINRGIYWAKNAGRNSQRAPFYFGDIKAGYMINKYISYDAKKPERVISENFFGLQNMDDGPKDNDYNKINGWCIDYGGLLIDNRLLANNKTARWVYKQIYKIPENQRQQAWDDFFTNEKYKNNEDIKVGLAASLRLLQDKEQNFLLLAQKGNNTIKEELAQSLNYLSEKKRAEGFIKIAENSDNSVKDILITHLTSLPLNTRAKGFYKLIEVSDNSIKEKLALNLLYLPPEKITNSFIKLCKNSENSTKKILANGINWLPEEEREKGFKSLTKDGDSSVKSVLAENIKILPLNKRTENFINLAKNADEEVKKKLANNLQHLPKENALEEFKKLAKNAKPPLKKVLIENSRFLPKEKRAEELKELAKESDNELKQAIAGAISALPDKDKADCFIQLAQNADTTLRSVLAQNLRFIPEEKKTVCFKKLAQDAEDITKARLSHEVYQLPVNDRDDCRKLIQC